MKLPATKSVLKFYGTWAIVWVLIALVGNAVSGHAEFGVSAHLLLSITGFPLAFLSFHAPNGTVLGTVVAGGIGLAQWAVVAEVNGRLICWWNKRHGNT